MKKSSKSEKLVLDEIADAAHKLKISSRGLLVGEIIAMIRNQLGMSQKVLARIAKVPQSTISRIEGSKREPNLSTIEKILKALSCEVIIVPLLMEPIDVIRRKQARSVAENNVRYLRGTMSLEEQEPDNKLIQELIKEEEEELLRSSGSKLWQE
jgi:transcriptional regulator with XRE-family HTH domain